MRTPKNKQSNFSKRLIEQTEASARIINVFENHGFEVESLDQFQQIIADLFSVLSGERSGSRRGPGRPAGSRGPGRPKGSKGPGRPKGSRGPGRPKGSKGPGRPKGSRGPGRPKGSKGPGRPVGSTKGPGRPAGSRGPGRPPKKTVEVAETTES